MATRRAEAMSLEAARLKKKFQWRPYSETCSWYPDAFTLSRRARPRASIGTHSAHDLNRHFRVDLEEKNCLQEIYI